MAVGATFPSNLMICNPMKDKAPTYHTRLSATPAPGSTVGAHLSALFINWQ